MSRKGVVPQDSSPERFCRRCSEWTQPEGPSGPTPARSLGAVPPGPRHLCPLPCAPGPPTPRLGLSPGWVPLCPRGPFSARAPALPPCPQGPLVVEEKQGTDVPSGSRPLLPFLPAALGWLQTWPAWRPRLALPLLEPSSSLTRSSGFLWPRPKAGRQLTLGPPQVGFRGRRAEGTSGQRLWLSVTTRNTDSHRESAV